MLHINYTALEFASLVMSSGQGEGSVAATALAIVFVPTVYWGATGMQGAKDTKTLMGVIHNESIRRNYSCSIVADIGNLVELHEQIFCVFLYTLICIHVTDPTIGIR